MAIRDPEEICEGVTEIASECGLSRRAFFYQLKNGRLGWLEEKPWGKGRCYLAVTQSCWAHTSSTTAGNHTTWTENGRLYGRPKTDCSAGSNVQAAGNLVVS